MRPWLILAFVLACAAALAWIAAPAAHALVDDDTTDDNRPYSEWPS